eukprot:1158835-Pelagomonas_calceolata.AAC.10
MAEITFVECACTVQPELTAVRAPSCAARSASSSCSLSVHSSSLLPCAAALHCCCKLTTWASRASALSPHIRELITYFQEQEAELLHCPLLGHARVLYAALGP